MSIDQAHPVNPAPLTESDIYAACRDFVLAYAQPAMLPDNVIQGWQHRASLPEGSTDFAVISVIGAVQRGTTVETFTASNPDTSILGVLNLTGLMDIRVKVDCCSDSDLARQRAQRLAVVTRSSVGVDFFNGRSLSALYAEEITEVTEEEKENQFLQRYAVILHLSCWCGDSVEMEYFDRATLARLENVDAHHPANK